MIVIRLVCLLLITINETLGNPDFGYNGLLGPQNWGKNHKSCQGKHQSPINIEEHHVINLTQPLLRLAGLHEAREIHLENNGHTVMLRVNDTASLKVSGGPLGDSEYSFEQLHFHWGENDHEGSEDLINNHSFAMELHAVFYKKSYDSLNTAVDHADGLTVLAYFFQVSEDDNPTYKVIVDALTAVESVGSDTKLPDPMAISSILKPQHMNIENYFTYNGSLTTPPCSEVVTWIDFKDPLPLSHRQISAFRNVRSTDGHKLTHNFRPIQPLEDRKIYHNIPESRTIPHKMMETPAFAGTSTLTISYNTLFFSILPELSARLWSVLT